MEDITGRWAKLSPNNRESQTVELAPDPIDNTKTLIAKFFTKRRTNMEAINVPHLEKYVESWWIV